MLDKLIRFLTGATLFTIPWVGVGVLFLASGNDLGAGFQPAYLLLATTIICSVVRFWLATRLSLSAIKKWILEMPVWWRWSCLLAILAVLLSGLGIKITSIPEPESALWGKFIKQTVQLLIMFVFLFWAAIYLRSEDRWQTVARLVVAGACFQAFYGVCQYLTFYSPLPFWPAVEGVFTSNPAILSGSEQLYLGDTFRDVPRLRGTVCEPLYLGNYLLAIIPLVFLTNWRRSVNLVISVILVILLLLTWSRGAWLSGIGQLIFGTFLLMRLQSGTKSLLSGFPRIGVFKFAVLGLGVVAGLVIVFGILLGWQAVAMPFERLVQSFSQRDWSNLTRLYSMQAAWEAFKLSPICGVGWGQFGWHFPFLVDPMGLQSQFSWPVVNNLPLAILCETGIIGAALFVFFTVGLLIKVWCYIPQGSGRSRNQRKRVLLVAVSVAGVWLQLLTFSQYNLPHIWLVLGMLLAALGTPDSKKPNLPG